MVDVRQGAVLSFGAGTLRTITALECDGHSVVSGRTGARV